MPLDDDDLFDSPAQPKKPSNKIVYQPPGAQWSLDRLPEVESLYQSSFKKRLPLTNRGQGSIHNKWGYDHRNSADVAINPATPEGQQFVEQLKQANIPFLAFTGAIPGVATGPHVHIGFPSQRTQQKIRIGTQGRRKSIASDDLFDADDDLFDSSEQSPPSRSADTAPRRGQKTAPTLWQQASAAYKQVQQPKQSKLFQQLAQQRTIDQQLRANQSAQGVGELRRLDDREAARIQNAQQVELASDPFAKYRSGRLTSTQAQNAAQRAVEQREDEQKAQANEPRLQQLTAAYRKEIQRHKGLGIGPEQWLNEAAAKGAAGLVEFTAGAFRDTPALAITSQLLGDPNRADIIALHAQAMQRAAEEEGADRNRVSRAIQNVVGGTISSAPEMGMIVAGAPPMAAFGLGGVARSRGRGERPREVVKAGAHGVATGGAFQLPIPAAANPLTRVGVRTGTTGLATGGLEASQGASLDQAVEAGITNALMAGVGEVSHIRKQPSSLSRGLEREAPREQATPDAEIAARLRGEQRGTQAEIQSPVEAQRAEVESGPITPRQLSDQRIAQLDALKGQIERTQDRSELNSLIDTLYKTTARIDEQLKSIPFSDYETRGNLNREAAKATQLRALAHQTIADLAENATAQHGQGIQTALSDIVNKPADWAKPVRRVNPRQLPEGVADVSVSDAAKVALEPPDSVIAQLNFGRETPTGTQRGVYKTTTARGREYSFDLHRYKLADGRERLLLSAGDPKELVDAGAIVRPVEGGVVVETIHGGETGFKNLGGVLVRQIAKQYGKIIPDAEAPFSPAGRRATEKLAQRQGESQRFFHRDYGEVTESPNQKQVGKNRVRVIAEDGREHVVKRPTGTGAGNQRAVPIKESVGEVADVQASSTVSPWEVPREPLSAKSVTKSKSQQKRGLTETETRPVTEIVTPANDTVVGRNAAGEQLYQRADGSIYRMRHDRADKPHGYPDFGGDLASVKSSATESVTNRQPSTTTIKNASMAEDRARLGLPELEQSGVRNAQEVHAQAVAANRANPHAVDTLVAEASSGAKNYTDVETAQVRLRAQEIKNRIAELDREIVAAKDEAVVLAKQAEVDALTVEFDRLSEATHKAGAEWGRAGVARQQAIDEDFSLSAMTARVRADKLKAGKGDLTEAEKSEIKELYRKHEELETQLLAANEQLAQQRLQTEIDRVSQRRQRRTQSKQTLDEEFVQLKADLSQALAEARRTQPGILASLDPEGKLTPIIAKMARNRIKAGVVDATQLVDDVYTAISSTLPGVTKREVRDAISGYSIGPKSTRSELQKQVDALKSELKGLSKEEDIAAGRRSSRQEGPAGEFRRDQTRQRQLQKQIAELESRINRGDFSDNPKREPPPRSRETQRLEKERERIRNQYEELRFRAKLGRWGYALHTLSGLRKSWILSGPSTQVKNIGGTGGYQLFDEVSRLPAVIVDAAVAPITGQRSITGPSPVTMLDSALHAYKKGGREAVEIMKTGATKEQLERHQFNEINTGVKLIDFTGNLVFRFMSASDRVFYEYAYKRNLTDRAKVEAKNTGKSVKELTNNPPEELIAAAKHDALVSTFNNNNRLSDAIRRGRSSLGPEANFAIDMIMPFDRTPTNVVMRIVEASPVGAGRATYKFVKAIINKSLTQEQQRQFSQTMGRATVGTALMGLGWTLADDILEVDRYRVMLKLGSYRIDLASISPVGNLLALGARLRESYDKGDQFDAIEAVGSVPLQQPLIKGAEDVAGLLRRPRETLTRGAGRLATSFIPFSGMAKFVGETLDPKEREAKGFKEQFQRNVPLWRQQLPEYVDRRKQRAQLGEDVRMGRKSPAELEQMVREGQITEARKQQILRDAKVSEKQARFNDYVPSTALDRYERMDAAQREEVREQMEKKAYNLTHSDTLTEQQKVEFQQRLDKLGIVPRGPKKSSGEFKDLFKQSASPF